MIPILVYHTVGDYTTTLPAKANLSVELFRRHMEYFERTRIHIVSLDDVIDRLEEGTPSPESKTIALTFDDGYEDNYHIVFPIIQKYGVPITIFLTAEKIGSRWDTPAGALRGLEWKQIREMAKSGLVTFGSHGISHVNLTGLSGPALLREIAGSKTQIEDEVVHLAEILRASE